MKLTIIVFTETDSVWSPGCAPFVVSSCAEKEWGDQSRARCEEEFGFSWIGSI